MSAPYKYYPETNEISNGECTMHVTKDMPEWIGKDLSEDDFEVDSDRDNHLLGVAIPIKNFNE